MIWSSPADNAANHWIFGIEFTDLDEDSQKRIAALIEQAGQESRSEDV